VSRVDELTSRPTRWVRWAYEYTLSLNLAWIAVWVERGTNKFIGGRILADYIAALVGGAYQLASPIGGHTVLEQLVWSFALAAIGFLFLRLLSRFPVTQLLLSSIGGVVSIASLPIAACLSLFGIGPSTYHFEAYRAELYLEVVVVLICALLFYFRKRFLTIPLMIVVLVLHFAIWAWVTGCYVNIPSSFEALRSSAYYHPWKRTLGTLSLAVIFNFGFPVIGFLASLTWALYIKLSGRAPLAIDGRRFDAGRN